MESVVTKIKNPKTGRMINIYGDTYYKLIKNEGYTEAYLLSLTTSHRMLNTNNKIINITATSSDAIPDINYDVYYNLLIQSDYKTIKSLCLTNTTSIKVCSDDFFWKNKFIYDDTPILAAKQLNNMGEWINEYINVNVAKNTADDIFKIWKLERKANFGKGKSVGKFVRALEIQVKVHSATDRHKIQSLTPFNIDNSNGDYTYWFKFRGAIGGVNIVNDMFLPEDNIKISYGEARQILMKILYHFPDIDVTDQNDVSFLKNKLLQNPRLAGTINTTKKRLKLYEI